MADRIPAAPPTLTALLDGFTEPMILIDEDYRIRAANSAYREAYGHGADLCGQRCYEVSHHFAVPCDQAGEVCPLRRSRESGRVQRVFHLHHTPHGEEHVDVETYPVAGADGRHTFFLEVVRRPQLAVPRTQEQALVGRSPAFTRLLELVQRVAPSRSTVMLLGESGTGKELIARAIHDASPRHDGPFVPVECSGLTEALFESELFGHERGAFTGAFARKQGLVEAARGGTLFLDEVGDIPLSLQVKLLRLLETGTYRPVGSTETQRADFRLVCATHRALAQMVEEGRFRRDLYYRLNVFPIHLPSLRERVEDLPLLVEALLRRVSEGRALRVDPRVYDGLAAYPFPGNIRELRNLLERAALMADGGVILPEHLPEVCAGAGGEPQGAPALFRRVVALEEMERRYLEWAVATFPGSNRELAERLGLGERTLYRRLTGLRGGASD